MLDKKTQTIKTSLIIIFVLFTLIVAPYVALTNGRGLENSTYEKFYPYHLGIGILSLMVILFLNYVRIWYPATGKYAFLRGYLHNPEENVIFGKLLVFRSPVLNSLLWLIIFSGLIYFFAVVQQVALADVPLIPEQVAGWADFLLATEPAVTSENLLFWAMATFVMAIGGYFMAREKGSALYLQPFFAFIAGIMGAIFGVAIHSFRYAGDLSSLGGVAIFWGVVVFISAYTYSIIPLFVAHYMNNILFKLVNYVNPNSLNVLFLVWLFVLVATFIISYIVIKSKRGSNYYA